MSDNYICDKAVCAKCKYRTSFDSDIACWYYISSDGNHKQIDSAGHCLTFVEGNPPKKPRHVILQSSKHGAENTGWDMRFSS